jgi:hypothetical protein
LSIMRRPPRPTSGGTDLSTTPLHLRYDVGKIHGYRRKILWRTNTIQRLFGPLVTHSYVSDHHERWSSQNYTTSERKVRWRCNASTRARRQEPFFQMIQPSLTSDPQLLRAFQTTQCELSGKLFLHVTIRMKDGTRHVGQLVGMQSTQ